MNYLRVLESTSRTKLCVTFAYRNGVRIHCKGIGDINIPETFIGVFVDLEESYFVD